MAIRSLIVTVSHLILSLIVRLIAKDHSFTSAAYIHDTLVSIMWYGSRDMQSYCAPITIAPPLSPSPQGLTDLFVFIIKVFIPHGPRQQNNGHTPWRALGYSRILCSGSPEYCACHWLPGTIITISGHSVVVPWPSGPLWIEQWNNWGVGIPIDTEFINELQWIE